MSVTSITSREFNQDVSGAKRAAQDGPVYITDRGKPAHVLLTVHEYERITGGQKNILDQLSMPGVGDIDFEPEPIDPNLIKPADLS